MDKRQIVIDNFQLQEGQNLAAFSKELAMFLHDGIKRLTGVPYFEHLREVSETTKEIIIPSEYSRPVEGAGWLHDSAEDIDFFEVYNAFDPPKIEERDPDKVYLNELVRAAHEKGEWLCYLVDRMTNRGEIYFEYMEKKFTFSKGGVIEDLDILSAILKLVDRKSNTKKDEILEMDQTIQKYMELKNADDEELKKFYSRYKVSDAFRKKGSFEYNVGFFVAALNERFREKVMANALDNLSHYIPKAETKLLVPYFRNRHELFHYDKLRQLLKEAFMESLEILQPSIPNFIQIMRKSGYNRGNEGVPGYVSLRKEIRGELV